MIVHPEPAKKILFSQCNDCPPRASKKKSYLVSATIVHPEPAKKSFLVSAMIVHTELAKNPI